MLLIAGATMMTMACAPAPAAEGPEAPQPAAEPSGTDSAACDASKAQHLVGRDGTEALAAEAKRLSGANTARFLRPGQIVTMEFRADRLNILVDETNKVTAIRCG
jgi:hypothetical protein